MKGVAFGVVYTQGLGSAGFGTGGHDGDLEAAFIRLNNVWGDQSSQCEGGEI
jgi:hypothetical protein